MCIYYNILYILSSKFVYIFFNNKGAKNINIKLQKEEINEKNINRKKIELYNRFIEYLSKYKNDELPSKEEINAKFIKKLDRL